jgi:hypothetical protein
MLCSVINAFSEKNARKTFIKCNIQFVKLKNQISAVAEKKSSEASAK